MTPTPDLLKRVREATGADRELDAAIATAALGFDVWPKRVFDSHTGWTDRFVSVMGRASDKTHWESIPEFTASLDAALALVERLGRHWSLSDVGGAYYIASIADRPSFEAKGRTPALALLAALLSSLDEGQDR